MQETIDPNDFFEDPTEGDQIEFYTEDLVFHIKNVENVKNWIKQIIANEQKELVQLSYVLCSDAYLLKINQEYLDHDTYTDIITFPLASDPQIESDIFISIDRVKENATSFEVTFERELLRVVIHGVLHLCGYGDKSNEEAQLMRQKENEAIDLFYEMIA